MTDNQLQQAHSSLRSGENQSEVEGLRCENIALRALLGDHKISIVLPSGPKIPRYEQNVLDQFNGEELSRGALRGNKASISMALTHLTRRGLLKRTRHNFYQKVHAVVAAMFVCLSGFSQPSPLSAPANPPVKKSFLTWDRDSNKEWKVYTGPARGAWTNSMFISTNFIPYAAGVAYGISAWDSAMNMESPIINYPSNRVAKLVIEARDMETGRTIETPWLTYTNAAAGSGKMLRLREDFLRWE